MFFSPLVHRTSRPLTSKPISSVVTCGQGSYSLLCLPLDCALMFAMTTPSSGVLLTLLREEHS